MKTVVNIMLIESSTAGNAPKAFVRQTVEITVQPPTVVYSVDNFRSEAHHPSTIIWHGGAAKDLCDITHVKMTNSATGATLIDGELNRFYITPHDVAGGVCFDVL